MGCVPVSVYNELGTLAGMKEDEKKKTMGTFTS